MMIKRIRVPNSPEPFLNDVHPFDSRRWARLSRRWMKTAGRAGRQRRNEAPFISRRLMTLIAAGLLGLAGSAVARAAPLAPGALPTGGKVVSGSASIRQSGNRMTVDQGSHKLIANWRGFDIGADA
uniref:Uncharacterized protein n=1 Tax=Candidatus Kentrum sp. SD TaxID=2126332 RepID=A0A450YRF9_9GAMM|nr:MAG: hypothetical protein BECKSD772F_GA0070984_10773 [Candidatus Kentron sp. SD]VFK44134.1 MAG: hypothetical protein BECKSD772F_GA0070984_11691 [Candidatus Kentron sp. SD]VFK50042.1 MAG: hypothetical protein BECKSD772E_GA0070983_13302 [Candidatus Kentron sp. SD]VFK80050.1 MAG: hypothetical protein BECKSD772D_GA0070982_10823 [Candidatus Kentron sp. SD]